MITNSNQMSSAAVAHQGVSRPTYIAFQLLVILDPDLRKEGTTVTVFAV